MQDKTFKLVVAIVGAVAAVATAVLNYVDVSPVVNGAVVAAYGAIVEILDMFKKGEEK